MKPSVFVLYWYHWLIFSDYSSISIDIIDWEKSDLTDDWWLIQYLFIDDWLMTIVYWPMTDQWPMLMREALFNAMWLLTIIHESQREVLILTDSIVFNDYSVNLKKAEIQMTQPFIIIVLLKADSDIPLTDIQWPVLISVLILTDWWLGITYSVYWIIQPYSVTDWPREAIQWLLTLTSCLIHCAMKFGYSLWLFNLILLVSVISDKYIIPVRMYCCVTQSLFDDSDPIHWHCWYSIFDTMWLIIHSLPIFIPVLTLIAVLHSR